MSVDLHGKGGSESSSSISDEEDGKVWNPYCPNVQQLCQAFHLYLGRQCLRRLVRYSSYEQGMQKACLLCASVRGVRLPLCHLQGGKPRQQTEGKQVGAGSRWGASYWAQISILFLRAVKTRRFDSLSTQDIVQFVIVGLLSGAPPQACPCCLNGVLAAYIALAVHVVCDLALRWASWWAQTAYGVQQQDDWVPGSMWVWRLSGACIGVIRRALLVEAGPGRHCAGGPE